MSSRVTVWPTCMESCKAWPPFLPPYSFMHTSCPQLIASPCPFHQSSSHARYPPSMICLTLSRRRSFHHLPHLIQFITHSFLIQPPSELIAPESPSPPFPPDTSHPEPPCHSIRVYHTRNPFYAVIFHPEVTPRNPFCAAISHSGCLTPQNPSPPLFPPRCSVSGIPSANVPLSPDVSHPKSYFVNPFKFWCSK